MILQWVTLALKATFLTLTLFRNNRMPRSQCCPPTTWKLNGARLTCQMAESISADMTRLMAAADSDLASDAVTLPHSYEIDSPHSDSYSSVISGPSQGRPVQQFMGHVRKVTSDSQLFWYRTTVSMALCLTRVYMVVHMVVTTGMT